MKVILDTSAYVAFKLNLKSAVDFLMTAHVIYLSPIVIGELMFGFHTNGRFKENMADLDLFLAHELVAVPRFGKITADRYSRIAYQLKAQGTPIPTNDIWIGAQSMELGAELLTSDRHFEKIPGLVYTLV
ncbi:MAG: type II toxin-antitoxin system VapC family toxin [Desulfobacteraceae bacterium]|jgi:tRNA(fMet)-specific endonuclease VapC